MAETQSRWWDLNPRPFDYEKMSLQLRLFGGGQAAAGKIEEVQKL